MTFLKKILLVDYQPRVATEVRKALEETGQYLIKEEPDTRMALKSAQWFQPDLILFDINIATPNGESVARQLQSDPNFRGTPVVFLSMNSAFDGGAVSGGILSGYSFLANPIRLEGFVRYVAELLNLAKEITG